MNLLYLGSHSILEYDQVKLWSQLGYDVFSIGAYTDPSHPGDDKRPALADVRYHADFAGLVLRQRERHAGEPLDWAIDWAKADLAPELVEWADAVICDCFPVPWLAGQWARLRDKRVIWRTIGQSNPHTERAMTPLHDDGLEIVRYSPAERVAFGRLGTFAGEDALIRFSKDADEWYGWTGGMGVTTVAQGLKQRDDFTHYDYFEAAVGPSSGPGAEDSLTRCIMGPGSEELPGGLGAVSYERMRARLRIAGAYLYTGTQPASYTLGLIEAMMTGVPTVSIGPSWMWLPDLFEGHAIAELWSDDPRCARDELRKLLTDQRYAQSTSERQQARAIELFGEDTIGAQWQAFLGEPYSARDAALSYAVNLR